MAMRDRSNLLKNLLVMGAAGAGLLISLPALAQSTEEPAAAPEEFKLSAEGFKILCEHFPLNSRCEGGQAGEQPTAVPSSPEPRESVNPGTSSEPSFPPAPSLSPEPSTPDAPSLDSAPSVEPSTTEPSGGMSPGDSPSGGMEAPQPSLPSAPDSTKPQSLTVPGAEAPKGERRGSTPEAPASEAPSAAPGAPAAPAPSAAPSAPSTAPNAAPSAAPTSGTPAVTEVSEAELQKFAKVIPKLQEIQQTAQQQVSEAIKKAGLTEDRFRELYTAQQSPSGAPAAAAPASAATPQEQQAVQQVTTQLESIKTETQTRREQAVRSQGLELNRFNEILAAVRQDSSLQQQLQQMLNN
jgi:Domain of unknown function (DUF4168)